MQRYIGHTLVAFLCYFCVAGSAVAQSKIYVDNQTDVDLKIINVSTRGNKINKKAWKKGTNLVAPGERKSILSLNRSGKLNWMDPTPRFVEPGKTVTFHTEVVAADSQDNTAVTLLQKLYGEGKTTKMWYAIEGVNEPVIWEMGIKEYTRRWNSSEHKIKIEFKAFKDRKKTHVEYIFSYQ